MAATSQLASAKHRVRALESPRTNRLIPMTPQRKEQHQVLQQALDDIARFPPGDLVRCMAEAVAADEVHDLLAEAGPAALREVEESLDEKGQAALCGVILAELGHPLKLTAAGKRQVLVALAVKVVNESTVEVDVPPNLWDGVVSVLQHALRSSLRAVSVQRAWTGVANEPGTLTSATAALSTLRYPEQLASTIHRGRHSFIFAVRLEASESECADIPGEWKRHAPAAQEIIDAELPAALSRLCALQDGIRVWATPAAELPQLADLLSCD